jgi:Helix-turn-helix domain
LSVKASAWAWDQPVGGNEKLVLLRLADHANDEGACWPSQGTMHVKCGISERTVRNSLIALEQRGLISREPRFREGRRTTDLIRLCIAAQLPANLAGSQPATVAAGQPADTAGGLPAKNDQNNRQILPDGNLPVEPKETTDTARSTERAVSSEEDQPAVDLPRRELIELSERLAAGIRQADAKAKVKPRSKAWLEPLRLLVDRDRRSAEEVRRVIDWVAADEFEHKVVLSPAKLRERFTQLALKADVAEPARGPIDFRTGRGRLTAASSADLEQPTPAQLATWAAARSSIADVVEESAFRIWIASLHAHAISGELVLGAPDHQIGWVRDRYGRLINATVGETVEIVNCGCEQAERAA